MVEIAQYNQARLEIEARFKGLPHACASIVKSLITIANPITGMVSDLSWSELCRLIEIEKRPGRKNGGIPTKEVVREYVNTIIQQCGAEFRLATVGQKLQFQFINMPAIYATYFTLQPELHTVAHNDISLPSTLINTDSNNAFTDLYTQEDPIEAHTDFPTAEQAVKNINILINKQNKLTAVGKVKNLKKLIAQDFYPSEHTVAIALSRGLENVTNPQEIQKFIHYNLENNHQWSDFNPVFLMWLTRDEQYRQTKQQINARSKVNERTTHPKNSYAAAMAEVLRANADALCMSGEAYITQTASDVFDNPTHSSFMDPVYSNLWSIMDQQTGQQR